jgi:hypothetical protein
VSEDGDDYHARKLIEADETVETHPEGVMDKTRLLRADPT